MKHHLSGEQCLVGVISSGPDAEHPCFRCDWCRQWISPQHVDDECLGEPAWLPFVQALTPL